MVLCPMFVGWCEYVCCGAWIMVVVVAMRVAVGCCVYVCCSSICMLMAAIMCVALIGC